MRLNPLFSAPLAVQLHLATVVPAFVLGTWLIFWSRKGGTPHRTLGAVYLALMAVTALAATFIRAFSSVSLELGAFRFGLLHLFVPLTAWSVWTAVHSARRGQIEAHRGAMRGLYFGGLVFAGLLALTPGRLLYRLLFE